MINPTVFAEVFENQSDPDLDNWPGPADQYAETLAQYQNEVAMYGDAWPGAQQQLAELLADVIQWDKDWEAFNALAPPPQTPEPATNEEPF
jgi:formylglycine-generating enzyme required for sulfatase activity